VMGCLVIIFYGIQKKSFDSNVLHEIVHIKTIPEFFGTVGFLFAIHVVILPILQQLRTNTNCDQTHVETQRIKVIIKSFAFITIFNALFGLVGYFLFANSYCKSDNRKGPCSNVLGNMEDAIVSPVKILLCVDLMMTIPMVLAASREIIEIHFFHVIENKMKFDIASRHSSTIRTIIRTLLVFFTFLFSIFFPQFSRALNFVGGCVCSLTGFILPPLLYTKLHRDHLSYSVVIFHRLISLFGIILIILTIIFN